MRAHNPRNQSPETPNQKPATRDLEAPRESRIALRSIGRSYLRQYRAARVGLRPLWVSKCVLRTLHSPILVRGTMLKCSKRLPFALQTHRQDCASAQCRRGTPTGAGNNSFHISCHPLPTDTLASKSRILANVSDAMRPSFVHFGAHLHAACARALQQTHCVAVRTTKAFGGVARSGGVRAANEHRVCPLLRLIHCRGHGRHRC